MSEQNRQARITCEDTECGEWNCDDCHPETRSPRPLASVSDEALEAWTIESASAPTIIAKLARELQTWRKWGKG